MLPQTNRIKKKKDFESIFLNSRSVRTNLFILKIARNLLGINRFGFVVSLKVSKKATVRNKVRRRLVEAIGAQIKNIKIGTDLVLIALPGIEKKDFSEIKETVNSVLAKSALIIK